MKKAAQLAAVGGKRKAYFQESESELSTSSPHLKTRRLSPENSDSTAANSTCDHDHVSASFSSSNGSGELGKVTDLQEEHLPAEFSGTSSGDSSESTDERRETPSGAVESGQPESHTIAENMPLESELEEFFTAAEENLRKKFINRYNFDIAKDQPLEGRYEWVQIQLNPRNEEFE